MASKDLDISHDFKSFTVMDSEGFDVRNSLDEDTNVLLAYYQIYKA